jgi:2-methylisocitrate lyase-like PEP mutase family enzyme
MSELQIELAQKFHAMHTSEGCFLMPNAWDIGSAKMLIAAGFQSIGTSSAGVAFSLGRPDNVFCSEKARLNCEEMLAEIGAIAGSVSVPVNADLEAGFGAEPEVVAQTIGLAIKAGAVGGNIEDYSGDAAMPLYDLDLAVARIKAARETIDKSDVPFVLVGRTDELLSGHTKSLDLAIRRANLYREAGADCLFVPGGSDRETVNTLVKEIDGPINVVMGLSGSDVSFGELESLGVRRVSIGGSLARAVYYQIRQAAEEMFTKGTFGYAEKQIPQGELNAIFQND